MKRSALTFLLFLMVVSVSGKEPMPPETEDIDYMELCAEGEKLLEKGDIVGAYELYVKCINANKTGNSMVLHDKNLLFLSRMYSSNGDYARADEYIQRAIAFSKIRSVGAQKNATLAVRYEEAAGIKSELGDYDKALEYADIGLKYVSAEKNANVLARLKTIMGEAYLAKGEFAKAKQVLDEAVCHIITDSTYYHMTPEQQRVACRSGDLIFMPPIYRCLGRIALAEGDTLSAADHYKCMYECASNYDPAQQYEAAAQLADLLPENCGDRIMYAAIADSLSYIPTFKQFENGLILATIEFPLRERELRLEVEHQRLWNAVLSCSILLCLALFAFFAYLRQKKMRGIAERQAAELVKANLQKDRLIALSMASEKEIDKAEIQEISDEKLFFPDIKLTKREMQIAKLSAEGLLVKEIADQLEISEKTVGVHKSNLYRKLGISNNIELLRYLQKTGN